MSWINCHRPYPLKVKGLSIKQIFNQPLFQHLNQVLIAPSSCKTCFNFFLSHDPAEKITYSKGSSTRSCLKREALPNDAGHFTKPCG